MNKSLQLATIFVELHRLALEIDTKIVPLMVAFMESDADVQEVVQLLELASETARRFLEKRSLAVEPAKTIRMEGAQPR